MFASQDLRLYLRVLCIVGIICAQFDSEKCLLQSTTGSERYALFYTLAILTGSFSCFTYVYLYPQHLYVGIYNQTGNFYETINVRCFCVGLWLLHICFYMRRRRHIELVQKLLQLHRLCSNPARDRYFLRNFLVYKALLLQCMITYFTGNFFTGSFSLIKMIYVCVYTYSFLVMCLLLVFFVCLQHIVAAGLAHRNGQLEQSGSSMLQGKRFIWERYRLLGIITVELNQCFGLLMLPIVPLVLIMAPTGPLFLISTVLEGKIASLFQYIIMFISGCIWNAPWLGMMSYMMRSNVITVEANKTAKILAKIPRTGTGLDRMVEKFLLKNLRQQPILTAYGFFALDKSTLFKLFTAIFTYMVILVQFKEMENSTKALEKT